MRRTLITLFVVSLAVFGCDRSGRASDRSGPRSGAVISAGAADCGWSDTSHVDGEGVGALGIGQPVEQVKTSCAVLSDTIGLFQEGLPSRQLQVRVGTDTVVVEVDSGRVWRIAISSSRYRTSDSLGVGSSLSQILMLRDVRGISGEGALFAISPAACGMSFRLSDPPESASHSELGRDELKRLPDSTRVVEMLIVGRKSCR